MTHHFTPLHIKVDPCGLGAPTQQPSHKQMSNNDKITSENTRINGTPDDVLWRLAELPRTRCPGCGVQGIINTTCTKFDSGDGLLDCAFCSAEWKIGGKTYTTNEYLKCFDGHSILVKKKHTISTHQ
jgi:DNA-directed RNA polymerase subunit RPC12/RpoP